MQAPAGVPLPQNQFLRQRAAELFFSAAHLLSRLCHLDGADVGRRQFRPTDVSRTRNCSNSNCYGFRRMNGCPPTSPSCDCCRHWNHGCCRRCSPHSFRVNSRRHSCLRSCAMAARYKRPNAMAEADCSCCGGYPAYRKAPSCSCCRAASPPACSSPVVACTTRGRNDRHCYCYSRGASIVPRCHSANHVRNRSADLRLGVNRRNVPRTWSSCRGRDSVRCCRPKRHCLRSCRKDCRLGHPATCAARCRRRN